MTVRGSAIWAMLIAIAPAGAESASISDVRIAIEREKDHLFVREMIALSLDQGSPSARADVAIPLPRGAYQATLADDMSQDAEIIGGKVHVRTAPSMGDASLALMFRLPLRDGVAIFDQEFGLPVAVAHAALLMPGEKASMRGDGFGAARLDDTPDGMKALFIAGDDFEDGRLSLMISGLMESGRWERAVVAAVSFAALLLGIGFWLRRRIAETRTEE